MKFLKWTAIIVLIIVVIGLIVAIVLPSEYRIERSIVINAPVEVVYEQIADLQNWNNWGPWVKMEQEVAGNISTPSRGVGAHMDWDGDTIGSGSIDVLEMVELVSMRSKLTFDEDQFSDDVWEFEVVPEGTKATWAAEGELSYPVGRLFGLFLESMLGDMYEEGLASLKAYVEAMPAPEPVPVEDEASMMDAMDESRAQ
jgi:Polyketide cyclase / dehydrase and lipid transport